MRIRILVVAACLTMLPLSATFADEVPEPPSAPMGPLQNGNPDDHPSQHTGSGDSSAMGSAGATAADPNDARDQNAVGSEFDGSHPAGGDDTPSEPGGTHVEPNGNP